MKYSAPKVVCVHVCITTAQISFSSHRNMSAIERKRRYCILTTLTILIQFTYCQTIDCPRIYKRSVEIDLEEVRQKLLAPTTISNHLTAAWGFPVIMASGWATGGNLSSESK